MSRVVVTGGAGFIGSHLVEALLDRGHEAVAIDNLASGSRHNLPNGTTLVEMDVRDDLAEIVADSSAVFHVAGQASISKSFDAPQNDLSVNVEGTLSVVDACIRAGVRRLIFASSMTAYGEPKRIPTPEEEPCVPVSYYGVTKYAAERYVQIAGAQSGVDLAVTSLRMFNVYGERQSLVNPYQGVLAIFLGNLLRGEPLTIHGDGSQTRDFVYVRDVTDAWLRVLEDDRTAGRTYNVGTGVELSISQLADAALAAFGRTRDEWPVIRERPQRGDVTRSGADITLLTETVGWTPQTSLHDGLARTAAWARRQDGEDVA